MMWGEWDVDKRLFVKTVVFVSLLVVVAWSGHSGAAARQRESCAALNETRATLSEYIESQIKRSLKSLPSIAYYQNHPVDLGRAIANLERQRTETEKAFAPVDC